MKHDLDRQVAVAQWYLELRKSNNATFLPLFADEHRYLVLMGGGGSGKSIFAGRKVLERCVSEPGHPAHQDQVHSLGGTCLFGQAQRIDGIYLSSQRLHLLHQMFWIVGRTAG